MSEAPGRVADVVARAHRRTARDGPVLVHIRPPHSGVLGWGGDESVITFLDLRPGRLGASRDALQSSRLRPALHVLDTLSGPKQVLHAFDEAVLGEPMRCFSVRLPPLHPGSPDVEATVWIDRAMRLCRIVAAAPPAPRTRGRWALPPLRRRTVATTWQLDLTYLGLEL
jgi:hypothetical protein